MGGGQKALAWKIKNPYLRPHKVYTCKPELVRYTRYLRILLKELHTSTKI